MPISKSLIQPDHLQDQVQPLLIVSFKFKPFLSSISKILDFFHLNKILIEKILSNHHPTNLHELNPNQKPKLILTHDFKGGYIDNQFKRDYTFEYLNHVDTFIYFSHQTVSIPPVDWVTAAKNHGTSILGTLIFESVTSIDQLKLLLIGPNIQSSAIHQTKYFIKINSINQSEFDIISTYFADRLIDLAIIFQFHGWLINIEVDILQSIPNQSSAFTRAFKIWLEYLQLEGRRRVGSDWQVCWYDSISYLDGRLQWQSHLHPQHNLAFFSASSSIFLDYHWSQDHIKATETLVDQLIQLNPPLSSNLSSQQILNLSSSWRKSLQDKSASPQQLKQSIFFGVDVFGRGCPFGGGFSSWKAASQSLQSGFSVALFAQAWTWESHHLHPDRSDSTEGHPNWWKRWWRDERYFWSGLVEPLPNSNNLLGPIEPPNAYIDACRIAQESKQPIPKKGLGFSELPKHKPFNELFPVKSSKPTDWFYTNWSLGSGSNGIWIQGQHYFNKQMGISQWTDMAMSFPIHDLAVGSGKVSNLNINIPVESGLALCDLIDHIGWSGSGCVKIEQVESSNPGAKFLWMNTTAIKLTSELKCRLVWKPAKATLLPLGFAFHIGDPQSSNLVYSVSASSSPASDINPSIILVHPSESSDLVVFNVQTRLIDNGWHETVCELQTNTSTNLLITRLGITLPGSTSIASRFCHYVGELSIVPHALTSKLTKKHENQVQVRWEAKDLSSSNNPVFSDYGKAFWEVSDNQTGKVLMWVLHLELESRNDEKSDKVIEKTKTLIGVIRGYQEILMNLKDSQVKILGTAVPNGKVHSRLIVEGIGIDGQVFYVGYCQVNY
ncbi:hypothetical protein O181_004393 [Austropuccinia psidii MF-1]|uniref:Cytosolic endo-beta-N-acetylglucosaminidase TIM barrel domain-containing protein n=1 Tax=Austropuccinia psidii MF-1 TaxID=1389203 RepID=A0A9Q3GEH7_9BASI|nr:hypothetical protein [Austropuccinia psidii MF-1]